MKPTASRSLLGVGLLVCIAASPCAALSKIPQQNLTKLLLGKDVKTLIDLPATKEGLNVYVFPKRGKELDSRGIDIRALTKYLRSDGVGIAAGGIGIVTGLRFDKDRVEVQISGGPEGARDNKHGLKVLPGLPTLPGVSSGRGFHLDFCYQRKLTDSDLEPTRFLHLMSRLLDVSAIQNQIAEQRFPPALRSAIQEKVVTEGMTYQMVLMTFGAPDQKKINDDSANLSETWYYMEDGHRWVVEFLDGKVSKVRVY